MNINDLLCFLGSISNKAMKVFVFDRDKSKDYCVEFFMHHKGLPVLTVDDEVPQIGVKVLSDLICELNTWKDSSVYYKADASVLVELWWNNSFDEEETALFEILNINLEDKGIVITISSDNEVGLDG